MILRKILMISIALCVFTGGASALSEDPWLENITITSGTFVQTVTFGTNESGSDGYDQGLDLLAPPPSPSPVVDVYFPVDHIVFDRLYGDIRYILNDTNQERVWTLQILSKNEDALLEWDPATLPADIAFTLSVAGSEYDMKEVASVSLTKSTSYVPVTIQARYSSTVLPKANFTANVTAGTIPLTVQFTDTSTGNPTDWFWDFGDGATSTEQHPVHTYTAAGTYTVTLTATNAIGSDTLSRERYITVLDAMPIVLSDAGAAKGQTTQALLTIRNASAIGGGSLNLTYNPAVVTVDAVNGASPWHLTSNIDNAKGKARIFYFTAYGQSGDVPICTITLRATGEPGDVSPLNINATELVNANAQDMTFAALPVPGKFQVLYPDTTDPIRYRDAASGNLYKGILSGNTLYFGEEGLNLTHLGSVQRLVHYSNFSAGTVDATIDVPDCCSLDVVAGESLITGRYYAWGDDGLLNGRPWVEIREPSTGLDVLLAGTNTSVNGVTLTDNVTLDFALENNLEGLHTTPAAAFMDIEVTTPDGGKLTQFRGVDLRDIPLNASTIYARGISLNDTDLGFYTARAVWPSTSDFAGKGYDSNTVSFEIIRSTTPPVAGFMANVTIGTIPLAVAFTDTSTGNVTSWAWDFGDGNTSTDRNPTHTYIAAGTYTVSLNASNAGGSSTETKTGYITVMVPPVANFSANTTAGIAPLTVRFTGTTTENPSSWLWTFGDGNTSTDQNPIHTYKAPGIYTVSLNASSAYGFSAETKTDYILVLEPPAAAFTAIPTEGNAPLNVQFTDQSTGNVTARLWSFGDGNTSTEQNPQYTYTEPGTYSVTLNASNVYRYSISAPATITVLEPPVAAFTANVTEGKMPLAVRFTDQSTGDVTAWRWSFGDDTTSTEQSPIHTYRAPGTYTVSLNASNAGGSSTETKTDYITVIVPPPVAAFTTNVTGGNAPLTVRFNDASTGEITAWLWSFGDDATATTRNCTHTYEEAGTYTARLTLTGPGGNDVTERIITVTPPTTGAAFTANTTAGPAPLTVRFTDTSANSPSSWLWDFGDGNSSTEQHPTHTYALPGNHTVTLSINNGAETYTKPNYIKVTPILFGDANEDGAVNQADTLLVLQEVVGVRQQPVAGTDRFQKADIHVNGVIEVGDALFIAQYNVGLRDIWFEVL